MSWPLVKLKQCCLVVSGGTPKREIDEYWGGSIDWVTPKDLSSLGSIYIDSTPEKITDIGLRKSSAVLLPEGSVLFSSRAPIGHIAITAKPMATNQGFKSLIPSSSVDALYLYFCLKHFKQEIEALGNGATFKEVSKKVVENFAIPLPPLDVQRQIAAVLEKADTLRNQCQQMEQELNALAQSVFLDMFGDPVTNDRKYPKISLIDLVNNKDDIKCGPFGTQLMKSEFTDSGVPLWGIKHVNSGFKLQTHEFVTKEKADELKSYSLSEGDIVMTRKGTVGNCHLYPSNLPIGVMHSDLLKIKVDESKIVPEFLVRQFRISKDIERQLLLISQGAIMAGINVGKLKGLTVLVPPIAEQLKFVHIIDSLNTQIELNGSKYAEAESIFNSLMQRAFKGELTLEGAA